MSRGLQYSMLAVWPLNYQCARLRFQMDGRTKQTNNWSENRKRLARTHTKYACTGERNTNIFVVAGLLHYIVVCRYL